MKFNPDRIYSPEKHGINPELIMKDLEASSERLSNIYSDEPSPFEVMKTISKNTKSIEQGLANERTERRAGDEENKKYTKRVNRVNLFFVIIGVLISAASLLVSFLK